MDNLSVSHQKDNHNCTVRKKPLTPADHRKRLDKDVHTNRGKFRTVPRSVTNSQAFACLGRGGMIFVISMFDALVYEKGPKKKDRKRKVEAAMMDGGEFIVTNAELVARGLKSPTSIAKARKEAWEVGFFDVVQPATVLSYGKYRYSERWRSYPSGDYHPTDQSPPGLALHPQWKAASPATNQEPSTPFSVVKAEAIFPASENEDSTPENVVKPTPFSVVKEPEDGGAPLTTENVVKEGGSPTPLFVVTYNNYHAEHERSNGTEDGTVQKDTDTENGSEESDVRTHPDSAQDQPDEVRTDPDTDFCTVHVQEDEQTQENGNDVDPIDESHDNYEIVPTTNPIHLNEADVPREDLHFDTTLPSTSAPTPLISEEDLQQLPLTYRWFVRIFERCCHAHGIMTPDLSLSESSGKKLDRWIDRILRNRTIKEKRVWIANQLDEIIENWNDTFLLSRREPIPTLELIAEDMDFLVVWNEERKR